MDGVMQRNGAKLASVLDELAHVSCPETRSARIVFVDEFKEDRSVEQLRLHLKRLENAVHATLAAHKRALLEVRDDLSDLSGNEELDAFRKGYAQGA